MVGSGVAVVGVGGGGVAIVLLLIDGSDVGLKVVIGIPQGDKTCAALGRLAAITRLF